MFRMSEPTPESQPPPETPPKIDSIFEAARLGWNVKLTCWNCGHVRILHAAALWLKAWKKGWPDDLREVKRYGKCMPCLTGRNVKIGGPRLELTREAITGAPMTLPDDQQWKAGLRWQRR